MAFDSKLDLYKREVNLVEYAMACGFSLLKQESSRNSAVMRSEGGEKIVIAKSANGHWIYFSVHNSTDNGTIINFVLKRRGENNLGRVKKELSPWVDGERPQASRGIQPPHDLLPSSRDKQRVLRSFSAMRAVTAHGYLASRGITSDIVSGPRFNGRICIDERRNAVFPHVDSEGICGYEIKNRGFTGFAPGGEKALWKSNDLPGDSVLVIAESAIDAMSFFAVKRLEAVYTSTAGAWGPRTSELLMATAQKLPPDGKIILAFDHDEQGLKYAEQAKGLLEGIRAVCIDLPPEPGDDWNDHLKKLRAIYTDRPPQNRAQEGKARGE